MESKPVKDLRWVLSKAWSLKWIILAGILTGAEALVSLGIELPGSSVIPVWARSLLIVLVMGGAFVARIIAARKEANP